jgi:hypothetical protein
MASVGLTQEEMASVLEIAVETLAKHFAIELYDRCRGGERGGR